jgi:hypothetical protein
MCAGCLNSRIASTKLTAVLVRTLEWATPSIVLARRRAIDLTHVVVRQEFLL